MVGNKQLKENFERTIDSIATSYTYLENNRQELQNASLELEVEMVALNKICKDFADNKISVKEFRDRLISLFTKETDQLIIVDSKGAEISDEQKAMQNVIVLNLYDRSELETFAKRFYRQLSMARTFVHYKLNREPSVMMLGSNMMPTELNVFDEVSSNSASGTSEQ